jgi:hypothetical protein
VIETARAQVAELIGAQPREIIFTSCATESNNAAIHAALRGNAAQRHIVTSAVEHSSVLDYCMALEKDGYRVTYLPVDRDHVMNRGDRREPIFNDDKDRQMEFGHLFSGRYKALIVDGSGNGYLKSVCDYVHLSPVRAGLLKPEEVREAAVSKAERIVQEELKNMHWCEPDADHLRSLVGDEQEQVSHF